MSAPARWMTRRRLRIVDELIDAEMHSRVTIASLAAKLELSSEFFIRTFKATVGMTPHAYVMDRRVSRARALLQDSSLTLAGIAAECGLPVRHTGDDVPSPFGHPTVCVAHEAIGPIASLSPATPVDVRTLVHRYCGEDDSLGRIGHRRARTGIRYARLSAASPTIQSRKATSLGKLAHSAR